MTDYSRVRYPQMPQSVDSDVRDTFSELIRTLDAKDKEPVHPFDVYGKTVEYGGISLTGLTFIGLTNVGTPTADMWNVYEVQIPRDVGTVIITNPDTSPRTQVRVYLPKASLVEGRTISILMFNNSGVNPFNVGVYTVTGDNYVTYPIPNPTLSGSISAVTHFTQVGGMASGLPLYGYVAANSLAAGVPSSVKIIPIGVFDSGTSAWFGPILDSFVTTPSLSLSVSTNQPNAWTFRAYGNLWYQIP